MEEKKIRETKENLEQIKTSLLIQLEEITNTVPDDISTDQLEKIAQNGEKIKTLATNSDRLGWAISVLEDLSSEDLQEIKEPVNPVAPEIQPQEDDYKKKQSSYDEFKKLSSELERNGIDVDEIKNDHIIVEIYESFVTVKNYESGGYLIEHPNYENLKHKRVVNHCENQDEVIHYIIKLTE